MYELDIYEKGVWQLVLKEEPDIQKIDKCLFQLAQRKEELQMRVLKDDKVLLFLNNSIYHYLYWKNVYVRGEGVNFNPEKIYKKKLEKKKKSGN